MLSRDGAVPLGAHPLIRGDVNSISDGLVAYGQAQVRYSTGAILLYQDIFRFEVSVCNARLSYKTSHLQIKNMMAVFFEPRPILNYHIKNND